MISGPGIEAKQTCLCKFPLYILGFSKEDKLPISRANDQRIFLKKRKPGEIYRGHVIVIN